MLETILSYLSVVIILGLTCGILYEVMQITMPRGPKGRDDDK